MLAQAWVAKRCVIVFAAWLSALALPGCNAAEPAVRNVTLCLKDDSGVAAFVDEMRAIASEQRMRLIDSSAQAWVNLGKIDPGNRAHAASGPAIHLGIEGRDGVVVIAANLGLPPYQVALGFAEDANAPDGQRFGELLVSRLEKRWKVETLPIGQGALPMADCE